MMTSAQRDAVCKAYTLLGEHFEAVLLVVNFEVNNPESGELEEAHEGYWKGGWAAAVGLAEFAKDRILCGGRTCKIGNDPTI